jgi:dynein heavy chain
MRKYTAELEEFEEKRLDFTNAEKLFELPITMYPALMKVQKDMKGLESIFTLYSQQKVSMR